MKKLEREVVPTGIERLDKALGNGVPKNSLILVTGTAGTMKSSLSFRIAYENVVKGKNAIYISLEQGVDSILRQMILMDVNLDKIKLDSNNPRAYELFGLRKPTKQDKGGLLTLLDIGYERKKQQEKNKNKKEIDFGWLKQIQDLIKAYSKDRKADVVILDSLTALYHLEIFEDLRRQLYHVFEYIKDLKCTAFVINEMPPGDARYSQHGQESYMVDGVFVLSISPRREKLVRKFSIVKLREAEHEMTQFVMKYKKGKFNFSEDMEKQEFDND